MFQVQKLSYNIYIISFSFFENRSINFRNSFSHTKIYIISLKNCAKSCQCSLWSWQQKIYPEKIEKNDIRSPCFWENVHFFKKIWKWRYRVFWRMDVFLTKYGHESSDFFVRNRKNKNGILIPLIYNVR